MSIELNHTIVPAHGNEASAVFYKELFGFLYERPLGQFGPVQIEDQHLTLDFVTAKDFERHHYAFEVSEPEFDEIFDRIRAWGLVYGSGPSTPEYGEINHWNDGRGIYFRDPKGHLLELLTRDNTAEQFQSI